MDPPDYNDRERATIEAALERAKRHGCTCEPYRVTWEELQEPVHWADLTLTARALATFLGEHGLYLEHATMCRLRRMTAAGWN